jgi:hypothetical protein
MSWQRFYSLSRPLAPYIMFDFGCSDKETMEALPMAPTQDIVSSYSTTVSKMLRKWLAYAPFPDAQK